MSRNSKTDVPELAKPMSRNTKNNVPELAKLMSRNSKTDVLELAKLMSRNSKTDALELVQPMFQNSQAHCAKARARVPRNFKSQAFHLTTQASTSYPQRRASHAELQQPPMPPYRAKLGTMSQTLSRTCPSRYPGTGKTDAPHLAKRLVSLMKQKRCQCPGNVPHNVPNNVQDMDNVPQSTKACPGACKTHVQQKSQTDVPELAKLVPRSLQN